MGDEKGVDFNTNFILSFIKKKIFSVFFEWQNYALNVSINKCNISNISM